MRFLLALAALLNVSLLSARAQSTNLTQWPLHDTGFSDAVQWDHYSIMINGRRTFLWSGEMHYCANGFCICTAILIDAL